MRVDAGLKAVRVAAGCEWGAGCREGRVVWGEARYVGRGAGVGKGAGWGGAQDVEKGAVRMSIERRGVCAGCEVVGPRYLSREGLKEGANQQSAEFWVLPDDGRFLLFFRVSLLELPLPRDPYISECET